MKQQAFGISSAPFVLVSFLLSTGNLQAAGIPGIVTGSDVEEVMVSGEQAELAGSALSASVGTVGGEQLEHRPLLRPAEVLETVPGLIVTQHSGDGKANQYFLRGFNLDHGTDFASYVDNMPVNMTTHGHGQGYSDLNFLIPELVSRVIYKKGPYYAEEGDFSSAGSARISLLNDVEKGVLKLTTGEDDYQRLLAVNSWSVAGGKLLAAGEYQQTDGPWDLNEDLKRENLVLTYNGGDADRRYSVSLRAYEAEWTATDQIPQRLVDNGQLGRFGYVTDSSGGDTHRYSLSGDIFQNLGEGQLQASAYLIDYDLHLTSNPTYFVNDPANGDEFTQIDDRLIWGGRLDFSRPLDNLQSSLKTGLVLRYDDIDDVGLGTSQGGNIQQYIVRDQVQALATGLYLSLETEWNSWLTSVAGVRFNRIDIDVKDRGSDNDNVLSPQLSLRFGPWKSSEFFINYGQGYHSNDARGVVAAVDPVPQFAESEGAELGVRTAIIPNAQISFALFALDLDSELVFVSDDGTTEPQGASRRTGWELGAYYQPRDWLIIDADITESKAAFRDDLNGARQRVPDAVERVMSLGISADFPSGWHGGVRWRYLGGRALVEDNSVRSDSTSIVNMNGGFHFASGMSVALEVINVLDSEDNDISYLFESLTAGELAAGSTPVEDIHFHPVEPRTVRLTLSYEF